MTPTRYPLKWPVGWKRTQPNFRVRAKFATKRHSGADYGSLRGLTVSDGVARVLRELELLGVGEADVVISTNLQTRLDGLPRSDQGQPADPGVCVYWQKFKKPMQCMAIDQYDRVADNLAAVAASLSALRAIERHGGGVVLERAFAGFAALPAPIVAGMSKPWREVLGFLPDADVSAAGLDERYRQRISESHPDKAVDEQDRLERTRRSAEINVARDQAFTELENAQ